MKPGSHAPVDTEVGPLGPTEHEDIEVRAQRPRSRVYTAHYKERLVLGDGRVVHIRLFRKRDHGRMRNFFERMSERSLTLRFLKTRSKITDEEITNLVRPDYTQRIGFGMFQRRCYLLEGALLACAHLECDADDPQTAEVVIGAIDEIHGQGAGKILLGRICSAALERGVERLTLTMLSQNVAARRLFESAGWDNTFERHGDVTTGIIELHRPARAPDIPPGRKKEKRGLQGFLRRGKRGSRS